MLPILFLIYISKLFLSQAITFLSYIDNISLTILSTSIRKNLQILERETKQLYKLSAIKGIEFNLSKTELIYFTSCNKAKNSSIKLPNNSTIKPKETVYQLGIYFNNKLNFKQHVNILALKAWLTLFRLNRLTTINLGLNPHAIRQLYLTCVISIMDYGC